jgi:3-dehydroquinate synthase
MNKPLQIRLDLGERSYPILIGSGLLDAFDFSPHLEGKRALIVSDDTVAPLYLARVQARLGDQAIGAVTFPAGEEHKTLATVQKVLDALVAAHAGRDVTVLALGGGVVGDISGFAAACYMRGVSFIQVPTTLLAQVDSSVGGKTGVNHPGGKNLIGAFHQPRLVLVDTDTLMTLPERELRAGLAEVIKHGAIADADYFAWLEDNVDQLLTRDGESLAKAIHRSCEIKAAVVAEDETERGRRAILNFGHTFGHAIERSLGYGDWLHGEAVAAGMIMAAGLSPLDDESTDRLRSLLRAAGLPVAPPPIGSAAMADAMQLDKKALDGQLRFVLLKALGAAYVSAEYDTDALSAVLATADATAST